MAAATGMAFTGANESFNHSAAYMSPAEVSAEGYTAGYRSNGVSTLTAADGSTVDGVALSDGGAIEGANLMAVAVTDVCGFILCSIVKPMAHHKLKHLEELQRIVQGSTAYGETFTLKNVIKFLYCEECAETICRFKHGKSLDSLAHVVLFKILGKNLFYLNFYIVHFTQRNFVCAKIQQLL
jgi:hypothetical protein